MSDSAGRPPRKVVFVNRYFYPDESATSQMLSDIARGLAQNGDTPLNLDIHVIASRQLYDSPKTTLAAQERIDGVTVHRTRTTHFGRANLLGRAVDYASFYLSATLKLSSLLRCGDVVVAKTDPPMYSIFAAAIARLRGSILINWLQDVFPEVANELGANPLPRWLQSLLCRVRDWSLRSAHCNVVLGSRMRDRLLARGVAVQKIRVMENWAGDGIAPIPKEQVKLRRALGLHNKFVVAYSGNLGRAHEFDTVLQAGECLRLNTDVIFLFIGGGANTPVLRAAVDKARLDNFVFVPYQPRESLADSLASADVHLISLRPELEGLIVPSKFYGVLAAGRPAIFVGAPDGELARIINAAECGIAVDVFRGEELARAILTLQRHPGELLRQGLAARSLYERHFTFEHALRKWSDLLASVSDAVVIPTNVQHLGVTEVAQAPTARRKGM